MTTHTGKQSLERLYHEQLKIDDKWAVPTAKGFKWWADQHAQTIEVIREEQNPDGEIGYLVSVRTELLRDLDLTDQALKIIMLVTQYCSMAGPVYDPQKKTLDLCSLVRVYDNIGPWMNELISMASVLQIGEAKYWASEVAKASKAHPATSGHFENGERSSPDEMAEIIETLIVPMGQEPSKWLGDEFKDVVDKYMQRPPSIGATAGSSGCAVEFPYGEESSSLCQLMADVAHPRYGNGLFLHQSFPVDKMGEIEGIDLALSLNHEELTIKPSGYGFGSYVFRDKMINFVTFLPNIAFTPGLLPSLYYSCAGRARYISNKLSKIGWGSESYDVGRSSVMSRQIKEFRFGTKATGSAVVSSD